VTLRYKSDLLHIGVGRRHDGMSVLLLARTATCGSSPSMESSSASSRSTPAGTTSPRGAENRP
jgi:hypothetical protein